MHVSSTILKNNLGQYLETAIKEPVIVEKNGRPSSVLISYEEYQRFLTLEEELWGIKALEAEQEGYVGNKETAKTIKKLKDRIIHNAQKIRSNKKIE